MKILFTSLLILLIHPLKAQEIYEWESDYHHYQGAYKSDFLCKWMLTDKQRDSLNEINIGHRTYCGHMNVTLTNQRAYIITLQCLKNEDGKVDEFYQEFKGTYSVNNSGVVTLIDENPFKDNEFQIRERFSGNKDKKRVTSRGFKYKFKLPYHWITKKKLGTFCDGCSFNPDE